MRSSGSSARMDVRRAGRALRCAAASRRRCRALGPGRLLPSWLYRGSRRVACGSALQLKPLLMLSRSLRFVRQRDSRLRLMVDHVSA